MKPLKFVITLLLTALMVIVSPLLSLAMQQYGHNQFAVSTTANSLAGNYFGRAEYLAPEAQAAFERMRLAAASAGVNLDIISGFRNFNDQADLFNRQIERRGSAEEAARLSAPPGHSEHHTGYALDIRDVDRTDTDLQFSFETTKSFKWLRGNAASYSFELSFPQGNAQGVSYEPWHWRYVGSAVARQTFSNQLVASSQSTVTDSQSSAPQAISAGPSIDEKTFKDLKVEGDVSISADPERQQELAAAGINPDTLIKSGDSAADFLTIGDVPQYEIEKATIGEIADLSGTDLKKQRLADVQLVGLQTIGSLADAVPGLPETKVGILKPFLGLAELAGRSYLKAALIKFADKPLADLLKTEPSLADVSISELALGDLGFDVIPGLKNAKIGDFEHFEQATLSQAVPGLDNVKLGDLPAGKIVNGNSIFGIVDVAYGPAESLAAHKPITGSDVEGFSVPCIQIKCAYLELTDPKGPNGPLAGARWIKGGKPSDGGMMVAGGHGVLASFGGGKEPTGRMPFGPASNIKVVLTEVDEATGTGTLSLFLRVEKKGFGKTPFIFGPIPFTKVKETGPILVGIDGKPSFKAPAFEIGQEILDQIGEVDKQFPDAPSGDSFAGGSDDCTKAIVKASGAGFQESASRSVPLILKEAEAAKLSENQIAYVLATAQQESGMGKYMELLEGREEWGGYHARGFVGLTHKFNYQKFADSLGLDLINNPDLAAQPEIAAKILVQGMKNGSFTGAKLSNYINGSQADFYNARAIINGNKDSAQLYANLASNFQKALKSCGGFGGSCGANKKMIVPVKGATSSGFGPRVHPILGGIRQHEGDDIGASPGTAILAADCGKVVFADWEGGYGNSVVIEHQNKVFTRYAHQLGLDVKVGQSVNQGQKIGRVGSTGRSTGPHLHWEVRRGGVYGEAQDPKGFL